MKTLAAAWALILHTFLWLHSLRVLLGSGDLLLCVFCATHLCLVLASLCKINGPPCGVCVLLALRGAAAGNAAPVMKAEFGPAMALCLVWWDVLGYLGILLIFLFSLAT